MIQDIAPHIYHNEMSWQSPRGDDLVLLFSENGEVCAQNREGRLHLPTVLETALAPEALQYLFSIDRQAFYLADAPDTLPDGWDFFSTGALRRCVADEAMFACAAAGSLWRWYRGTRFCGRCGGTLEKSRTERAMVCPACGNVIYPKICPAIIAAVHDGERLVLTRYRDRPFKNLALIAGFNEIGESIEQTVRREVLEETGLHVKNLRFPAVGLYRFAPVRLLRRAGRQRQDHRAGGRAGRGRVVSAGGASGGHDPHQPDGGDDRAVPPRARLRARM